MASSSTAARAAASDSARRKRTLELTVFAAHQHLVI